MVGLGGGGGVDRSAGGAGGGGGELVQVDTRGRCTATRCHLAQCQYGRPASPTTNIMQTRDQQRPILNFENCNQYSGQAW